MCVAASPAWGPGPAECQVSCVWFLDPGPCASVPLSGECQAAGGCWELLCASHCRCGYQKLWPTSGSQVSFTRLSPEIGFQSSSALFLALGKASGGQSVALELVLDATGVPQSCSTPTLIQADR